jgi:1,4-dihydroxy-6-naphthoate synthase
MSRILTLGHSPDPDDAFMFYALAEGKIDTRGWQFQHILQDIQTLNERATRGELHISAISIHAYAHVLDKYALLPCGASMGDGYGPMLVAPNRTGLSDNPRFGEVRDWLRGKRIAIPGKMTSAWLALQLAIGACETVVVPFDEIFAAVKSGRADVGLIIHEGQLTYKEDGMVEIANMGKWWKELTGLPLPLGVNVVRKDMGEDAVNEVSRCMRESIQAGLDNRAEALEYALSFARGMDPDTSDEFVGMYVNERTVDMKDEGVEAIKLLLKKGAEIGMVPDVEIVVVD